MSLTIDYVSDVLGQLQLIHALDRATRCALQSRAPASSTGLVVHIGIRRNAQGVERCLLIAVADCGPRRQINT